MNLDKIGNFGVSGGGGVNEDDNYELSTVNYLAVKMYELALDKRIGSLKRQRNDILNAIFEAARAGQYRLHADQMRPEIVVELRHSGYKVDLLQHKCISCCKHVSDASRFYWLISWELLPKDPDF